MLLAALAASIYYAQTSGEPSITNWIPVGASVAGLAGALAIFWRYWRPALENQQERIEQLERDRAEDRIRIEMLVNVVREGGLAVPAGIWRSPPEAR